MEQQQQQDRTSHASSPRPLPTPVDLNVFQGPDSLRNYFDPDQNPPLPLVEIPSRLNPFRDDGVRIYAKMLTALPAQNVKALPALNMLLHEPSSVRDKSIVEASSGSTVLSLATVARVLWGHEDVTAHITNKKHIDQLRILRFFGLKISLYGGLAQQEPTDPRGIMARLRRLANKQSDSICYPGQYDNPNNWKAHSRWTGPQILQQLPSINVFCTTVGTGGCVTGTGSYLKSQKPSVRVIGVFNNFGDPTPGPRHFHGFYTCGFPWKDTVDGCEEVASADSYRMSMRLSREGLICGPSSGEALQGLLSYLSKMKGQGGLNELADPTTGEISCVFTCSDLPYQYMDGYFQRLGEDDFPDIENKSLMSCDQDRHDERWELQASEAAKLLLLSAPRISDIDLANPQGAATAWIEKQAIGGSDPSLAHSQGIQKALKPVDLRSQADFVHTNIPESINLPLPGLSPRGGGDDCDLFGNAQMVQDTWTKLHRIFDLYAPLPELPVLILCYDGETSRLATSILRARGVEAYSVLGGFPELKREIDLASSDVGIAAKPNGIATNGLGTGSKIATSVGLDV